MRRQGAVPSGIDPASEVSEEDRGKLGVEICLLPEPDETSVEWVEDEDTIVVEDEGTIVVESSPEDEALPVAVAVAETVRGGVVNGAGNGGKRDQGGQAMVP